MTIIVLNWNLERVAPDKPNGKELHQRIKDHKPDIVCLTETVEDFFHHDATWKDKKHSIASEPRPLFRGHPRQRKVVLWSRWGWGAPDSNAGGTLNDGRFVRAVTTTPSGPLEVIGVCIPWRDSHVRMGRKDCQVWEDHLDYLEALAPILNAKPLQPRIVVGDFNQCIPKYRQPKDVYAALLDTFSQLRFATDGALCSCCGRQTIDHVAYSDGLRFVDKHPVSDMGEMGRLSDHFGVRVKFEFDGQGG